MSSKLFQGLSLAKKGGDNQFARLNTFACGAFVLLGLQVFLNSSALAAPSAARSPLPGLAAHHAVYELSLLDGGNGPKSILSAHGRLTFDFTGDACEGYTLSSRTVLVTQSDEAQPKLSDSKSTTFEEGNGRLFRFDFESGSDDKNKTVVEGEAASLKDGELSLHLIRPRIGRTKINTSGALFPSAHTRRLIEMAKAGQNTLSAQVFDRLEENGVLYDTLSFIGKPRTDSEKSDAAKPLQGLTYWPVSISYFYGKTIGERTPLFTVAFDLYENGVTGRMKIDYGLFSFKGDLVKLELLPQTSCDKASGIK